MTKASYFSKPNRLHSMADVNRVLTERTSGRGGELQHPSEPPSDVASRSTPAAELPKPVEWQQPVTHGDGSGYMLSVDGRFSIVKEHTSGSFTYRLFLRGPGTLLSSHPSLKAVQKAANAVER